MYLDIFYGFLKGYIFTQLDGAVTIYIIIEMTAINHVHAYVMSTNFTKHLKIRFL